MQKIPWTAIAVAAITITIIGAILFPVFAQSKQSAKRASRLSDVRQEEIRRSMEEADRFVPPLTQMSTAAMAQERQVIRKGSISIRVKSV